MGREWTTLLDSRQDFNAINRSHVDIENSEGKVCAIDIGERLKAGSERGRYPDNLLFGKRSLHQHQEVWIVVGRIKKGRAASIGLQAIVPRP